MRSQAQTKRVSLDSAHCIARTRRWPTRRGCARSWRTCWTTRCATRRPAVRSCHAIGHPRGSGRCWIEVTDTGEGSPRRGPAAHLRPLLPRHGRLGAQDSRQRAGIGDRAGADRGYGRQFDRDEHAGRGVDVSDRVAGGGLKSGSGAVSLTLANREAHECRGRGGSETRPTPNIRRAARFDGTGFPPSETAANPGQA